MCASTQFWLEIANLIVAALTPILVGVLAIIVERRTKRLEQQWKQAESIMAKRVDLYDKIGVHANRIYAYIWYVGGWKETSPRDVLDSKRQLDTIMHTYRPWFSKAFFDQYQRFIQSAFAEYKERGSDAKIRTTLNDRQTRYPKQWDPEWNNLFNAPPEGKSIQLEYNKLLEAIADELNLNVKPSKR